MKLTDKQVEALRTIVTRGEGRSYEFGSTTVHRLREAGLIRNDKRMAGWSGFVTYLVPTDAGRAALEVITKIAEAMHEGKENGNG